MTLLPTAICWLQQEDRETRIRVLLDSASNLSLLRKTVAEEIGLLGPPCKLTIDTAGGTRRVYNKEKSAVVRLRSLDGRYISPSFEVVTSATPAADLPPYKLDVNKYPHLKNRNFTEDLNSPLPRPVDLLLDSNLYYTIVQGSEMVNKSNLHKPRICETLLGDVVVGQRPGSQRDHLAAAAVERSRITSAALADEETKLITRFMSFEDLGIVMDDHVLSEDDRKALEMMKQHTKFNPEKGKYETCLLWKDDVEKFIDSNWRVALQIAKSEKQRSIKNGLSKETDAPFREMLDYGYAEPVEEDAPIVPHDRPVIYLPCHIVHRPDKLTTKARVVMNGAFKMKKNGESRAINSLFRQGPTLLKHIVEMLLGFRHNKHVVLADIQKMFWAISLIEKDSDVFRFWWKFDGDKEFKAYRCKSITFGIISSPSQSTFTLYKVADDHPEYPLAAHAIKEQSYVDDICPSSEDKDWVINAVKELNILLPSVGMKLTKFIASDPSILDAAGVAKVDRVEQDVVKILGLPWEVQSDSLLMSINAILEPNTTNHQPTKRLLIKTAAKFYDPLGLCAAAFLLPKLLFKKTWQQQLSWDDPLTDDINTSWQKWLKDVEKLGTFQIPRYISIQREPFMLIVMGDASKEAAAACAYVRTETKCDLIFAKTRVAPTKGTHFDDERISIARMELVAAVLCVRIAKYLQSLLPAKPTKVWYFTDSTITWHRIHQDESKQRPWVYNRLREIHDCSSRDQWRHCPGNLNSADIATRGCLPREALNSDRWWHGPSFLLRNEKDWPNEPKALTKKEAEAQDAIDKVEVLRKFQDLEDAALHVDAKLFTTTGKMESLWERYSTWESVVKKTIYILRFLTKKVPKLKTKSSLLRLFCAVPHSNGQPTVSEMRAVQLMIFRRVQQVAFAREMAFSQDGTARFDPKGSLAKFNPLIDEHGLVRSRTRLQQHPTFSFANKTPIILPKGNKLCDLFIQYVHRINQHSSKQTTYYLLLTQFAIMGGRRTVAKAVFRCPTLGCQKPVMLKEIPAPLPVERLEEGAVWEHVGVDLFGPIMVRHDCHDCPDKNCVHRHHCPLSDAGKKCTCAKKTEKRWGAIFTCLTSRAVHLELVYDMSTLAFMKAFTRFTSTRGTPTSMLSDQGKNFVKAEKELQRLYKTIDWKKVKDESAAKGIEWHFTTSRSSWTHGVTERLIKEIKTPLTLALKETNLTTSDLIDALKSIERLLQDRPLSLTSEDEWAPVTPSMLTNLRLLKPLPYDPRRLKDTEPQQVPLTRLHRQRQLLLSKFWKIWQKTYLQNYQITRYRDGTGNVRVGPGDVLLLHDKNLAQGKWLLARVVKCIRGNDGKIRRVHLRTPTHKGVIERGIKLLSYLPANAPY